MYAIDPAVMAKWLGCSTRNIRLRVRVPPLPCRHLGIGSLNHNGVPDMTRWLCFRLVRCAKIWQHVLYAPRGVEVCVGMKQVEVRVIMYSA